jgi:YD repeat-containing protein
VKAQHKIASEHAVTRGCGNIRRCLNDHALEQRVPVSKTGLSRHAYADDNLRRHLKKGNLTQATTPDGYSIGFEYDEASHVIKAFDQEGSAINKTLDLDGKPRTVTDPNGNTVSYEYYGSERDGRLKKQIDAIGRATTYDYDLNGNVTAITDNLGRSTLTYYDELNRTSRVVGPAYIDATLGQIRPVTRYTYDPLGNLSKIEAGRTDSLGTNGCQAIQWGRTRLIVTRKVTTN